MCYRNFFLALYRVYRANMQLLATISSKTWNEMQVMRTSLILKEVEKDTVSESPGYHFI